MEMINKITVFLLSKESNHDYHQITLYILSFNYYKFNLFLINQTYLLYIVQFMHFLFVRNSMIEMKNVYVSKPPCRVRVYRKKT